MCKPDYLLDEIVGTRIVETATDGARIKSRKYAIKNFFGAEWYEDKALKFPINFSADGRKYAFQCKFFPKRHKYVHASIELVGSPSEQVTVWLSITLSLDALPESLIITDEPILFAKDRSVIQYRKPRPLMPSSNATAGPTEGSEERYKATLRVEMHLFLRNVRLENNTILPDSLPTSPVHISYTWSINYPIRTLSLAFKKSNASPFRSSVFPSDTPSTLRFYGTISPLRNLTVERTRTSYTQVTAGLCYELLCKPRVKVFRDEILIKVSTASFTSGSKAHWHSVMIRSLHSATTSNPVRGCLYNISVHSFKTGVARNKLFVQQVFNIKYYGGFFNYHCSSNETGI